MNPEFSNVRRRRIVAAIASPVFVLALALYFIQPVAADRNEVILTVEIAALDGTPGGATVRVESPSGGALQFVADGHTTVAEGEPVEIAATPSTGFVFHRWEGGATGSEPRLTLVLVNDTVIRCIVQHESGENDGDGSTAPEPQEPMPALAAPESFMPHGTDSQLQPDTRNTAKSLTEIWVDFQHVGLEDGTLTNPYDTLAEGVAHGELIGDPQTPTDINIVAGVSSEAITIDPIKPLRLLAPNGGFRVGNNSFDLAYVVSVTTVGMGSVAGGGGYVAGSVATLKATPDAGWAFSHWEEDLGGYANPETLTVDSDKSVTAVFLQNPANLTVTDVELQGGGPLPSEATAGDSFTLEWSVLNDSVNSASSGDTDWVDSVFLSRDAAYSDDDKALSGSGATVMGPVNGSGTYMASVLITIPDVSPGDYHLIVRTDAEGEITQTASERASGVLAHPITLVDPEIQQ